MRLTTVDPKPLQQSGINYIQYQINDGPVNKDYGPRLWLLGLPDQGLHVWATETTVSLVGTDATSGVDYIKYSVDSGETWAQAPVVNGYGPKTFQATFTVEGVGEHNLSRLVFDVAGNQYVLGDQTIAIEGTVTGGTELLVLRLVITVDILGTTAEYPVTPEGRLIIDARTTSPDGTVMLEIPAGTLVLNADGTPTYLNNDYDTVFRPAGTPLPPVGHQLISAYQASPSGVTFSKDVRLIIRYDKNKLPQGASAVIAYYDEAKKAWTPLETAGYVAVGNIELPQYSGKPRGPLHLLRGVGQTARKQISQP